jgi:hypothetical protein
MQMADNCEWLPVAFYSDKHSIFRARGKAPRDATTASRNSDVRWRS